MHFLKTKSVTFYLGIGVLSAHLPFSIKADESEFVRAMARHIKVSKNDYEELLNACSKRNITHAFNDLMTSDHAILFDQFPALKAHIPYIRLGQYPTPVCELSDLATGKESKVYMKMDGLTGKKRNDTSSWFGGNKIRKLEFLLADARSKGAESVVTYGCIGSNHAVATAACCKQLGLHCTALLTPQPVTDVVVRNLLLMKEYGAEIIYAENAVVRDELTVCTFLESKKRDGRVPYFIPVGGSTAIGVLGYIEGLSELCEQILSEEIIEPDVMYVAAGSCGTAAGLLLGMKLIGLTEMKLKIVAIEPDNPKNPMRRKIFKLFHECNEYLHRLDPTIPKFDFTEREIDITFEYAGSYGLITPAAQEAISYLQETHHIQLDPTYTGKAFAALLHDLKTGRLKDKTVLFWDTFCDSVTPSVVTAADLPDAFRKLIVH